MRAVLATIVDLALCAVVSYLGFRAGVLIAGCRDMSNCPPLAPLVILGVVVGIILYFGAGYLLWRTTPGRRACGVIN
jgi:hypothetical protein